jgi:hypothetical protein
VSSPLNELSLFGEDFGTAEGQSATSDANLQNAAFLETAKESKLDFIPFSVSAARGISG